MLSIKYELTVLRNHSQLQAEGDSEMMFLHSPHSPRTNALSVSSLPHCHSRHWNCWIPSDGHHIDPVNVSGWRTLKNSWHIVCDVVPVRVTIILVDAIVSTNTPSWVVSCVRTSCHTHHQSICPTKTMLLRTHPTCHCYTHVLHTLDRGVRARKVSPCAAHPGQGSEETSANYTRAASGGSVSRPHSRGTW